MHFLKTWQRYSIPILFSFLYFWDIVFNSDHQVGFILFIWALHWGTPLLVCNNSGKGKDHDPIRNKRMEKVTLQHF